MSAQCWREQAHATPQEHELVKARFRALVRDREAHPPTRKGDAA